MKKGSLIKMVAVLLVLLFSMSVASAASPGEQRQHIRDISDKALLKLYSFQPAARGYVENAAGYAVFADWGVKLFLIGGGTGKGMAVNNNTNQETFMNMINGEIGFGLGANTYNAVFIFENESALNDFTSNGWQFGGEVTAAATDGVAGAAYIGAVSVSPGVWMYELTDKGLALELMAKGTKYSKNDLN